MDIDIGSSERSALPARTTAAKPSGSLVYEDARALLQRQAKPTQTDHRMLQQQTQHARHLLKLEIGRDLTLITEGGMRFPIHSIMLAGGPKYLEEQVFPDHTTLHYRPASITLPRECHHILVDRLVTFLYTKDYDIVSPNKGRPTVETIKSPFVILSGSSVLEATSPDHEFHLRMYALGELLQYEDLKTASRGKLLHFLNESLQRPTLATLAMLAECVNACFTPHNSSARWCVDEDGAMKQTIVAAVLHHEYTSWTTSQIESFKKYFSDPRYDPQYSTFCAMIKDIENENANILAAARHIAQAIQSKKHEQSVKQAKWNAREQVRIDARRKAAAARNALGSYAKDVPILLPTFTDSLGNQHTDKAKSRRHTKTEFRKARAQCESDNATLASKAFGDDAEYRVQTLHPMGSERAFMFLGGREDAHGEDEDDHEEGLDAKVENGMRRMTIDAEEDDFLSTLSGA